MTHGAGDLAERVRFDPDTGLVPAVVQSVRDGRVLMLAYMNREALRRTLEEGRVVFWSRSRGELWRKGDTSGHWLEAVEVRSDCDGDALLVRAVAHGPVCHTGAEGCFLAGDVARPGDGAGGTATGRAPGSGYGVPAGASAASLARALEAVLRVVAERDRDRPADSYTVSLLEADRAAIARKVTEEAVEVLVAALEEEDRLAEESADLLYHLAVLWRAVGIEPDGVARVLARRRGGEGTEEGAP